MKATISLDGVLTLIDSLALTTNNKQWLADKLLEEVREETSKEADRTEVMLNKHFGAWKDNRSAEEIISDIRSGRQSGKLPLNFD